MDAGQVHHGGPANFYMRLSVRINLAQFVGHTVLQIQGRCLRSRVTASFLELVIFFSFCFSGRGEGVGIWEDLACRRAAGGAVGNGLDVGD